MEEQIDTVTKFDPMHVLNIPGASFTIVLITAFIFPQLGLITAEFGRFMTDTFSVSVLLAFPIGAAYSYIRKKKISIKQDLVMVMFLSFFTSFLLHSEKAVWDIVVMYTFSIPFVLTILLTYFLSFEGVYRFYHNRLDIETWKEDIFIMFMAVLPTVGTMILLAFLVQNAGMDLTKIRSSIAEALETLTG